MSPQVSAVAGRRRAAPESMVKLRSWRMESQFRQGHIMSRCIGIFLTILLAALASTAEPQQTTPTAQPPKSQATQPSPPQKPGQAPQQQGQAQPAQPGSGNPAAPVHHAPQAKTQDE